jgi:Tfp pilus assembly protein PilN
MRAVNLLPPQLVEPRATRVRDPRLLIMVGAAVVVVAALGYARHNASSTVASRRSELTDVRAQVVLAARRPVAPPADSANTHLEGRSALVLDAASTRAQWDRLFRELALVLPNDVWLSSLKAQTTSGGSDSSSAATQPTADGGSAGFSIEGSTYSQAAVARLLSRLQMIPDLANVSLDRSEVSPASSGPATRTVQFTISASVLPFKGGT